MAVEEVMECGERKREFERFEQAAMLDRRGGCVFRYVVRECKVDK